MSNCSVGPRYCPKCGKELEAHISVCVFCRNQIEKRKVNRIRFPSYKEEKEPIDENIKNKRLIIGALILVFTLPFLNLFTVLAYYPPLFVLFNQITTGLLMLAFPLNLVGLWLFFSSLDSKFKGFFLIILGLFLFSSTFPTPLTINFNSIEVVTTYLIFIDIPITLMLFFGFILIYKYNNILDSISFIIVFFSNLFYWLVRLTALGY